MNAGCSMVQCCYTIFNMNVTLALLRCFRNPEEYLLTSPAIRVEQYGYDI
jgi:hypothetical protein